MGFNCVSTNRPQETSGKTFPAIPPNWGLGFAKPSQAQRVSLEGVSAEKTGVTSPPTFLGGLDREAQLNVAETAYEATNERTNEAGLDVKYNVTNNLTLDATVNTDFAQVEADSQQVNLTRFSLFFPEKRQFFQERSSLFEFNTGGISRLFHSRRIGLDEDGEAGAHLRWPSTSWTGWGNRHRRPEHANCRAGGIALREFWGRTPSPTDIQCVFHRRRHPYHARRHGWWTTGSVLGSTQAYVCWETNTLPRSGLGHLSGVELQDAVTTLSMRVDSSPAGSGEIKLASATRRTMCDRDETTTRAWVFTLRNDFTQLQNNLQYRWFVSPASPLRTITIGNRTSTFVRNSGRTVESASIAPSLEFEFKSGSRLELTLEKQLRKRSR